MEGKHPKEGTKMKNSTHEVDELKNLQRDAETLKARRERSVLTETAAAEEAGGTDESANNAQEGSAADPGEETPVLEAETIDSHYADQLAVAVKQLEDTTREHPMLALLAAFTTGVVFGNLFSRR
jgi:hypothetical protein